MTASSAPAAATGGWQNGATVWRWAASVLAMLVLHAGLLAAATLWRPSFDRPAPPAAMMIELAPLAAPPVPTSEMAPGIERQAARPIERAPGEEIEPEPVVEKPEEAPPPERTLEPTIEPPAAEVPDIRKTEAEIRPEPVVQKAEVVLPRPRPKPRPKPGPKPVAERVEAAPPPETAVEAPVIERRTARPIEKKVEEAPPAETAVERTTAPVAVEAPPAARMTAPAPGLPSGASSRHAVLTWQGALRARLERHKRYPAAAQFHGQEGMSVVRFSMTRDGRVTATRLERSSGYSRLDDEALALPERAQPLPPPPPEIPGRRIEIVVPVRFFLK